MPWPLPEEIAAHKPARWIFHMRKEFQLSSAPYLTDITLRAAGLWQALGNRACCGVLEVSWGSPCYSKSFASKRKESLENFWSERVNSLWKENWSVDLCQGITLLADPESGRPLGICYVSSFLYNASRNNLVCIRTFISEVASGPGGRNARRFLGVFQMQLMNLVEEGRCISEEGT